MRLERTYEAQAAHQLLAGVPDGHPCRRLHGHRYIITVTIIGDVNPETGMLLEYADIDARVGGVLSLIDHRFINDLGFDSIVVTRETGEVVAGTQVRVSEIVATPIAGADLHEPSLAAKVRENSTVENLADWMLMELRARFARINPKVGPSSLVPPMVYAVRIEEDSDSVVETSR